MRAVVLGVTFVSTLLALSGSYLNDKDHGGGVHLGL